METFDFCGVSMCLGDIEEVGEVKKIIFRRPYIIIKLTSGETIKISGVYRNKLNNERKKLNDARLHVLTREYSKEERVQRGTM